jgi:hypothetical protein
MEADDTTPSEGERDGGTDGERDADELVECTTLYGVTEAAAESTAVPGGDGEIQLPWDGETKIGATGYAYDDESPKVLLEIRKSSGAGATFEYRCELSVEAAEEIGAKLEAVAAATRREQEKWVSE